MNKSYVNPKITVLCFCLICSFSFAISQNAASSTIDLQKARVTIESLDKQFARHYFNEDSAAIFNMYAKDGTFGCLKGNEILSSWGRQIRNSIKNDTRSLIFTTTPVSAASEFLVELGTFEIKDSKGNSNHKGKYLVVWKQEDGNWKLYETWGYESSVLTMTPGHVVIRPTKI